MGTQKLANTIDLDLSLSRTIEIRRQLWLILVIDRSLNAVNNY